MLRSKRTRNYTPPVVRSLSRSTRFVCRYLSLEQQLIHSTAPALCLHPSPLVGRIATTLHYNRTKLNWQPPSELRPALRQRSQRRSLLHFLLAQPDTVTQQLPPSYITTSGASASLELSSDPQCTLRLSDVDPKRLPMAVARNAYAQPFLVSTHHFKLSVSRVSCSYGADQRPQLPVGPQVPQLFCVVLRSVRCV